MNELKDGKDFENFNGAAFFFNLWNMLVMCYWSTICCGLREDVEPPESDRNADVEADEGEYPEVDASQAPIRDLEGVMDPTAAANPGSVSAPSPNIEDENVALPQADVAEARNEAVQWIRKRNDAAARGELKKSSVPALPDIHENKNIELVQQQF